MLPSSAEYPYLRIRLSDGRVVSTKLVGSYNADNVMAALAVGQYFGVSLEDGVAAIEAYVPSNNRSQMTRTERNTLIVDAYNANPTSMEAALNNFANVEAAHKTAMLGDMLELGEESQKEHIRIAQMAMSMNLDLVCFVGEEFRKAVAGMEQTGNAICFSTSAELAQWLKSNPVNDSVILIKGSRGTRMENVTETV